MRIRRTELTTPGSSISMMAKAAASEADEVMLDLEDAVAPADKAAARGNIVDAIKDNDWGDTLIAVRINDLGHPNSYRDLIEVVEGAGESIDTIIVPKVMSGKDVYVVDTLLGQIESQCGIQNEIGIEVLIEETKALQNVDSIAASSDRLEALILGVGDYAASQGMNTSRIGANEDNIYPPDIWHYARVALVVAARSNGLDAIDGPFSDFSDTDGYRRECVLSKTLGFVGKWAIHPVQIGIANEVYSPSESEIESAKEIVEAMEQGVAQGRGAVQLDGEMLDEASVRKARVTLERAERMDLIED